MQKRCAKEIYLQSTVDQVKLGMLTNLPYLGKRQQACHSAETDY